MIQFADSIVSMRSKRKCSLICQLQVKLQHIHSWLLKCANIAPSKVALEMPMEVVGRGLSTVTTVNLSLSTTSNACIFKFRCEIHFQKLA